MYYNSILIEGRYVLGKYVPSKRVEIPVTDVNSAYARKPVIPTVEPVIPTVEPVIGSQGNWLQRNPKKIIAGAIGLNILRPGSKSDTKPDIKPDTSQSTNTQPPNIDQHNNWAGSIANHPNLVLGGTVAAGLGYLAIKKMKERQQNA